MKTEFKVLELSHDDIVTIISDGVYGNSAIGVDYSADEWRNLDDSQKTKDACFEDKCADLLLAGKSITIADYEFEGEVYGDKGKIVPNDDKWDNYYAEDIAEYEITLKDLLDACNSVEGEYWVKELINEEDDLYTGYNLLQLAMFGELIYG